MFEHIHSNFPTFPMDVAKNYCSFETEHLGTTENYKLALHILSCINTPLFIYGAWCIIFKTPAKMVSLKNVLLWSHFFSALLDLSLSVFVVPYVLLPTFSMYALGF
ncbi:hypothetical protein B9Z55_016913 [Caenorhabditis nigoni]|uniref:Uncharacterized protein n=2 Tax=Caenorhabditis nigoni TaxID=1611254 RepID=A0A2G5T6S6_9PELO|nr:hypothetical protein B9Z55_016913 [Caenorhabditis nigoni]